MSERSGTSVTPFISVVMSVLNGETYLKETIQSVLDQSYSHFEFIIINDGSTDQTQSILTEFQRKDERIHILINPQNIGLPKSLNRGLAVAHGDYIARIDAGDTWGKEKLRMQVAYLSDHPDTVLLGTQAIYIDEQGNDCGRSSYPNSDQEIRIWFLKCINPFIHPSVIFKPLYFYDEQFFTVTEDFSLWTKLFFKGRLSNLKEFLVRFRFSSNSITKTKRANQISQLYEIYKRFLPILENGGVDRVQEETPILPKPKHFSPIFSNLFSNLNYFGNRVRAYNRWVGNIIVFLSYQILPQLFYIKLKLHFLTQKGLKRYGNRCSSS